LISALLPETPRLVELALLVLVLEALAVLALWRAGRLPVAARGLLSNLAAGACLLIALRLSLLDAAPGWSALWLALALGAHVLDLRRRLAGPVPCGPNDSGGALPR